MKTEGKTQPASEPVAGTKKVPVNATALRQVLQNMSRHPEVNYVSMKALKETTFRKGEPDIGYSQTAVIDIFHVDTAKEVRQFANWFMACLGVDSSKKSISTHLHYVEYTVETCGYSIRLLVWYNYKYALDVFRELSGCEPVITKNTLKYETISCGAKQ